jgi:hypothetical protein
LACLLFSLEVAADMTETAQIARLAGGPIIHAGLDWEGVGAALVTSIRSTAYGMVNQLRDPAIYVEGEDVSLLYAVAGEAGIALAKVDFVSVD